MHTCYYIWWPTVTWERASMIIGTDLISYVEGGCYSVRPFWSTEAHPLMHTAHRNGRPRYSHETPET